MISLKKQVKASELAAGIADAALKSNLDEEVYTFMIVALAHAIKKTNSVLWDESVMALENRNNGKEDDPDKSDRRSDA